MEDRIERSIEIAAPLARVWDLVTEPGWWVGDPRDASLDRTPGAVVLRDNDTYGVFPVQVVELTPMSYASFRWASQFSGQETLVPEQTTLIEFTLAKTDGGVRVSVVESGFTTIATTQDDREGAYRSNSSGWDEMLGVLAQRAA